MADTGVKDFSVPEFADSPAGANFFEQHFRDLIWSTSHEMLARDIESFTRQVAQAVRETPHIPESLAKDKWEEERNLAAHSIEQRARLARRMVASSSPTAFEAILCRYVDNFLCYLSDLLEQILVEVPDVLASSDAQISVEEVFQHDDLDSLKIWLIDRKINNLSFQGLASLEQYCSKKFGLTLIPDSTERDKIALAVAARNLIVHRRGIIDDRFLRMAGASLGKRGGRIRVTHLVWTELVPAILSAVRDIDGRAARKFGFQAALVVTNNEVAAMQSEFFVDVATQVMGWRL